MNHLLEDDSTTGSPRALVDLPGPQNLIVADWAAASVQGRRRMRNEDSWRQLGSIFVVADGMGGLSSGDQASEIASDAVANGWFRAERENPTAAVRAANEQVCALTAGSGDCGSTLSAVRIAHDQATLVHVGDSRVYRIREQQAELLTRDHNIRSELLAAGVMPAKSRRLGPLRALTSYLGKPDQELQIDVRSVSLRAGDRLVLCTDGVFGEMSHGEFVQIATSGAASAAAEQLTSPDGSDDATAIVLDIAADQ